MHLKPSRFLAPPPFGHLVLRLQAFKRKKKKKEMEGEGKRQMSTLLLQNHSFRRNGKPLRLVKFPSGLMMLLTVGSPSYMYYVLVDWPTYSPLLKTGIVQRSAHNYLQMKKRRDRTM